MSNDLVILDVDGTLLDSSYLHALAWSRAFRAHGQHVPTWRIHRAIGMGGDKLVPALLGSDLDAADGDAIRARWKQEYLPLSDEAVPLPGAVDLVKSLHDKGFLVAAASSGESELVDAAIARLGIGELLTTVVSAADADDSKPDPDLLAIAIRQAGAERAVAVGDSIYDVEAAAVIALACVTVRTGGFGTAELGNAGAMKVFENLGDAIDLDWSDVMRKPDLEGDIS